MGSWSISELLAAHVLIWNKGDVNVVMSAIRNLPMGCLPRQVLELEGDEVAMQQLDKAIRFCDMRMVLKAVGNIMAAPEVSNDVVHVQVSTLLHLAWEGWWRVCRLTQKS